jgi:hypothetical protein
MFEYLLNILPDDLRGRLQDGGVVDAETLERALDADPALRQEVEALMEVHRPQIAQAMLQDLLARFSAAADSNELWSVWQQVPTDLERAFLTLVEARIGQAEQSGDTTLAAELRERFENLQQLMENLMSFGLQLQEWLDELLDLPDDSQLPEFWQRIPSDYEQHFLKAVAGGVETLERSGDELAAAQLRSRLEQLRDLQERQHALGAQLRAWLLELGHLSGEEELARFWSNVPQQLEELLMQAGETHVNAAEDAGERDLALRLRNNLAKLAEFRAEQSLVLENPLVQALLAFLRAADDDEARRVFVQRRDLLLTDEAQEEFERWLQRAQPEHRAHFSERSALLRRLRAA